MTPLIKSVYLQKSRLFIIDQRFLPQEEKVTELEDEEEVCNAIKTLAVRGAPAIGIVAAYGVYVALKNRKIDNKIIFLKAAQKIMEKISGSRPTAYNLFYAMNRLRKVLKQDLTAGELLERLKAEAIAIHQEDIEKSSRIAEFGLKVVPDKASIITHCNAGGLATGGLGTSLAVIYRAHKEKKNIFIYVDETRPLLQGARLTAWELDKAGIPYKIIADNMAGFLMQKGKVNLVIVGADRIARNGDFANKIGTYSLAVLAHYHKIPFYTAAPFSTFDLNCESGDQIPVEERDKNEILCFNGVKHTPVGADAYNPAFDITPHHLITGIITEFGIIYPPFDENIKNIL